MLKLREFSLKHFWNKIRESIGFIKCITIVDLTKKVHGESKFFLYPHVWTFANPPPQFFAKIPSNQLFH